MKNMLYLWILFMPFGLISQQDQTNVLVYGGGSVQVTSSLNTYENLVEGSLIEGSVMITHDANQPIDIKSFQLGNRHLAVEFAQSSAISPYSNVVVSIYKFKLPGMKTGTHTLPPISVKVGGKEYQAPPLTVQVG
jgi:hypothetical protein